MRGTRMHTYRRRTRWSGLSPFEGGQGDVRRRSLIAHPPESNTVHLCTKNSPPGEEGPGVADLVARGRGWGRFLRLHRPPLYPLLSRRGIDRCPYSSGVAPTSPVKGGRENQTAS